MNWEKTLRELVGFINFQTEQTDMGLKRLRAKEPEIESMSLKERLEYLEAVAEVRGKINLLHAIKDCYDSMVERPSAEN